MKLAVELNLGPTPAPTALIKTPDDLRFKEWTECRALIGRLDSILVDLRKVGFAFVTALLTASTFLSFLGVTTQAIPSTPVQARAAAFIVIMVLIAALFSVDSYYEVLLSGAVERALDLEAQTDPPVRITKYISINAFETNASGVTLWLYVVLLATAGALGLLGVLGGSGDPSLQVSFAVIVLAVALVLYTAMRRYWLFIAEKTHLLTLKQERHWRPGESATAKIAAP